MTTTSDTPSSNAKPRVTRVGDTGATGSTDEGLSVFVGLRPRCWRIAYRILHNAADADDVVQNVWLRWQTADRRAVLDARAFLTTTTVRLAVNLAKAARARRETSVGQWLPEPTEKTSTTQSAVERDETWERATAVLLEKLPPKERAAFVLREAFSYPYPQIADILRLKATNVRQLVRRARAHMSSDRRVAADAAQQKRLSMALIAAAQLGDLEAMESFFASEVASGCDDRGVVRDARLGDFGDAAAGHPCRRSSSPLNWESDVGASWQTSEHRSLFTATPRSCGS